MDKWEKRARIAGAFVLFALSVFCGWGVYSLSTSPILETRIHYVKIPDKAEIRPRPQIHAPSIDPSVSRTTDWHNFIISETVENVKAMAEQRRAVLLAGYTAGKIEYWLPRSDGIFYYAVESAPPAAKSEVNFSTTIRFDPSQKAFVYSFERCFFGIILFGLIACSAIVFGIIIIFPFFQKIKK